MRSHFRPVVTTCRGSTGIMLNVSNARLALSSQTLAWHSAPLAWGEAPSAIPVGRRPDRRRRPLDSQRDSSEPFDLAQHVDQALFPLRSGLGERDPDLAESHVEDRAELRFEPALVAIPTRRQPHDEP